MLGKILTVYGILKIVDLFFYSFQDQDGLLGTPVFLSASDVLEYIEILEFIYQGSNLSTWINGRQSKYR